MVSKGKASSSENAGTETETNPATDATVLFKESFYNDAQLTAVKSFADAAALVGEKARNIADVLGTGFKVLSTTEKEKLVGIPFIILECRTHIGDRGEFTSLLVVTERNEKFVVNDGSTGIHDQVSTLIEMDQPVSGLYVPNGLRKSEYDHKEYGASVTYYLDTSA